MAGVRPDRRAAVLQHGIVDRQIHAARLGVLPPESAQPAQREHHAALLRPDKGSKLLRL